MPEQTGQSELECVSCDTTFDPAPTGGFCPDCDTPHPDFGVDEDESGDADDQADESAEVEYDESDGDSADGDSVAFCPDCGADLADAVASDGDDPVVLDACPDCDRAVTDESYCPDCGTDLDAARAEADDDESAADDSAEDDSTADDEAADEDDAEAEDAESDDSDAEADEDADTEDDAADDDASAEEPITLVIGGESYGFGDGDTFGRQDEAWLENLVSEAGGSDDVAYISSEHLEFSVDEDGATVRDTSRNGTKLNGTELDGDETELSDGDTLELAERAEIPVELDD